MPMRDATLLFKAIYAILCFLWPVTALAATQSLGDNLSLKTIAIALVLSTLSGLTSLLHQMQKDLKDHGHIQHMWLYVSSKMLGSNVAGLLVLFWTDNFDPNTQAGMIVVAAFGGIWTLEKAWNNWSLNVPKKES